MITMWLMVLSLFKTNSLHHQIIQLGDACVIIQQQKNGVGKTFVHLHQNEKTALKAAQTVVQKDGGSLITLIHAGGRTIVFYLDDKRYEFDPNRIFTTAGIQKTLSEYSTYDPRAAIEVNKLADKIKALLPADKIIAVHNNASYSMLDYYPGHNLAKEAHSLHINTNHFYRNFFLVTQKDDYLRLKRQNFNSVWQASNPVDDGSLSVFLAKQSYVNVEAGYEALAMQIKMLRHA